MLGLCAVYHKTHITDDLTPNRFLVHPFSSFISYHAVYSDDTSHFSSIQIVQWLIICTYRACSSAKHANGSCCTSWVTQ